MDKVSHQDLHERSKELISKIENREFTSMALIKKGTDALYRFSNQSNNINTIKANTENLSWAMEQIQLLKAGRVFKVAFNLIKK